MLHKEFDKEIESFSLDNFFIYSSLSDGYSFLSKETVNDIEQTINKDGIEDGINNPYILNKVGLDLYNMPYTKDENGKYNFIMPALTINDAKYVSYMQKVSEIYKKLIMPIFDGEYIYFDDLAIITFSDKIILTNEAFKDDVNYLNIVSNIITIFVTQNFIKGVVSGQ